MWGIKVERPKIKPDPTAKHNSSRKYKTFAEFFAFSGSFEPKKFPILIFPDVAIP